MVKDIQKQLEENDSDNLLGYWQPVQNTAVPKWHRKDGKLKVILLFKEDETQYRIEFSNNETEEALGSFPLDRLEEEFYSFLENINKKYY